MSPPGPAPAASRAWQQGAVAAALGFGLWTLVACKAAPPAPPPQSLVIQALHQRCVQDMVRQTCRVMNASTVGQAPADSVVFVAGLGPVQAGVYNELRAAGDQMCIQVSRNCQAAWDGAPCLTARALYAAATP